MTLKYVDNRDGKEYNLVRIGSQLWFAENLRYYIEESSYMYNDRYSSFEKNGYLYSKDTLDDKVKKVIRKEVESGNF